LFEKTLKERQKSGDRNNFLEFEISRLAFRIETLIFVSAKKCFSTLYSSQA